MMIFFFFTGFFASSADFMPSAAAAFPSAPVAGVVFLLSSVSFRFASNMSEPNCTAPPHILNFN
jgi:hypothetical protein